MRIPFGQTIDQLEFFEFVWLYERLTKEKNKEQEATGNNQTISNNGRKDLAKDMMNQNGMV